MSDGQRNKITVDIYGQQYVIVGDESSNHIRLVAEMVDEKMREISFKNPSLSTTKLAVLTAVNTIHDYVKLKEDLEQLQNDIKQLKE
ncbi:cell division protein ZapA [Oikeobacillus pervagus]|uniref:Cell division protein ZapA n=1 Tax=Oikeobacillus pervagus TaxID=1325931 RepID=A0AAJ1T278_9BACI|nr:cell division protein ZapA [Oikeobacillus pervagus]MDQ0215452.1 cell division protein ZapA [Oikeobacillus pervagus]